MESQSKSRSEFQTQMIKQCNIVDELLPAS